MARSDRAPGAAGTGASWFAAGFGLLLVPVSGGLSAAVPGALATARGYAAAAACPAGAPRSSDGCVTVVAATVTGREDTPGGKSVRHGLLAAHGDIPYSVDGFGHLALGDGRPAATPTRTGASPAGSCRGRWPYGASARCGTAIPPPGTGPTGTTPSSSSARTVTGPSSSAPGAVTPRWSSAPWARAQRPVRIPAPAPVPTPAPGNAGRADGA